ncbi:MAG: HD domain-containing protein [Moorellaceae bacterium]
MLLNSGSYVAQVNSDEGEPVGWVDALDLLRSFLKGETECEVGAVARPIELSDHLDIEGDLSSLHEWSRDRAGRLPYFLSREKGISGLLLLHEVLADLAGLHAEEQEKRLAAERAYINLVQQIPLGIAIINVHGRLVHANDLARKIISEAGIDEDSLKAMAFKKSSRVVKDAKNHYYRAWSGAWEAAEKQEGQALLVFTDVTTEYRLLDLLRTAREEAEQALAVMLPDQRITTRLRSVVEYEDEYDPATGKIRITGVLEEGVYRHVINMLRLIAEAFRQGLMELPGIEKNVLVGAAVFHDLAKVQPSLTVGDMVYPEEVFEPGYLHALRGAALAQGIYGLEENVVHLIKYHHHAEEDLPPEFPPHLLPMYRFFRLVDGLSAGITRRGARVNMEIRGSAVRVEEKSKVPQYNRIFTIDLYTGATVSMPLEG